MRSKYIIDWFFSHDNNPEDNNSVTIASYALSIVAIVIGLFILHVPVISPVSTEAAADPIPKAASSTGINFTKIIAEKFTKPETSALLPGIKFPTTAQVRVISESPKTVVLYGQLITLGLNDNVDLWKASDLLKSQYGFKISNIISVGAGSEANPARLYIVMEHQ